MSAELKKIAEGKDVEVGDIWLGDHGHSWLLLSELLAYDWQQTINRFGTISAKAFAERLNKNEQGKPNECVKGPWGRGEVILMEANARLLWEQGVLPDDDMTFVFIEWEETYAQAVGSFYTRVLPSLQKLGKPENVRLVFGFDS